MTQDKSALDSARWILRFGRGAAEGGEIAVYSEIALEELAVRHVLAVQETVSGAGVLEARHPVLPRSGCAGGGRHAVRVALVDHVDRSCEKRVRQRERDEKEPVR